VLLALFVLFRIMLYFSAAPNKTDSLFLSWPSHGLFSIAFSLHSTLWSAFFPLSSSFFFLLLDGLSASLSPRFSARDRIFSNPTSRTLAFLLPARMTSSFLPFFFIVRHQERFLSSFPSYHTPLDTDGSLADPSGLCSSPREERLDPFMCV